MTMYRPLGKLGHAVRSLEMPIGRWLAAAMLVFVSGQLPAAEVVVAGVFPGKAVLMIDGGAPRAVAIGESRSGVRVLAIEGQTVTFEVDGKRSTLRVGEQVARQGNNASADRSLSVSADARGHFFLDGRVNGAGVRFLVDTGASLVSLGRDDARRAGLDYRAGQLIRTQTANGAARAWLVRVDELRIGGLVLHGVDAAVHERELPFALLGMSALNRMEISRESTVLTLKQRY
ncbi:retropepsin-like aspartic protease family protein [Cognatazoarcus halotolerans]|uniref:retropepsin-like aspartic protease family protein n=1 Tax=Cognatazoarcus halotolerans TaxID=2686016 RepID=UPI001F3C20EB|nr:TIGR02281 family clan AA aspartic protease [Cognatazoarcus halotolerans]